MMMINLAEDKYMEQTVQKPVAVFNPRPVYCICFQRWAVQCSTISAHNHEVNVNLCRMAALDDLSNNNKGVRSSEAGHRGQRELSQLKQLCYFMDKLPRQSMKCFGGAEEYPKKNKVPSYFITEMVADASFGLV